MRGRTRRAVVDKGDGLCYIPAFLGGRIAQLVEQLTLNQRVLGSSPSAPTKEINDLAYFREDDKTTV